MRVAVVFFAVKNKIVLQNIAKGLARGIEAQGHQVDLVDGMTEVGKRLTIYKYIAIGTEVISLFKGKITEKLSFFLKSAGAVGGKKSFAFLSKAKFGVDKTMMELMRCMEREGMYLKTSEMIIDPNQAEVVGKRLHITS